MLHHRPQSSTSPSSTAKSPHGKSQPNSNKNYSARGSKTELSLALPILLTLIAANFVALLIHVWYFLPDHSGSEVASTNAQLLDSINNDKGARYFKKRVRRTSHAHDVDPSNALKQALSKKDDEIVRYDIVPTVLDQTQGYYGVVHQLPSIPDRRRMIPTATSTGSTNNNQYIVPSNAVHNLTYFLESRIRPDEEDRPLFLYNPMILPLDDRLIDGSILSDLSLSEDTNNDVAYVAVYRASNFGNCHGPGRGVPDTYQNYLGLALLDRDLNIVQDDSNSGEYLDVVIDLNQHLYDMIWTPGGIKSKRPKRDTKPKQYMQDCQLFAARSKRVDKADRLILLCNEYAMPVILQRRRGGGNNNTNTNSNTNSKGDDENRIYFHNTYGSGLQLTALQPPNMILSGGKNMHYFSAAGMYGSHGPGFLEMWPGGPHEFLYMDFATYPFVDRSGNNDAADPALKIVNSSKPEPEASFKTIDNGEPGSSSLIARDSGSACCVPIRWKEEGDSAERTLLLGFSHRKTRRQPKAGQYNYVSRVYAFEPLPPFAIVARSGFFCLGFAPLNGQSGADDEALQSDNEQVWGAANEYKLKIRDEEFDCPRIHFVTGVAEKMGDNETVIVSYGVNDCYPRMIEVTKSFLVGLLRP
ncbi:hypothetical protein ACHAXR_010795 [Thalassiosira sp. AJA248-18]